MKELWSQIQQAFADYEEDAVLEKLELALQAGLEPMDAVRRLSQLMEDVGKRFSEGELFLPDMIMAGDLMETCLARLKPVLEQKQESLPAEARVVLGTVKGDVHDIGKNMVKTMLSVSGFEVIDLGTDVSSEQFYTALLEEKPDFLALSSCMTTTVPSMQDTIDLVCSRHLEEKTTIVVGGGSVNPTLAGQMGNCVYGGHDAFAAVGILRNCLNKKQKTEVTHNGNQ